MGIMVSVNEHKFVQEEVIEGYFYFRARIKVLDKDPGKIPLVVIFKGSEAHGKNWSLDCKLLEETLLQMLAESGPTFPPESYILKVKVGTNEQWEQDDCPFKGDQKVQLKILPTVLLWKSAIPVPFARLEGREQCTAQNLKQLFVPSWPSKQSEYEEETLENSDMDDGAGFEQNLQLEDNEQADFEH